MFLQSNSYSTIHKVEQLWTSPISRFQEIKIGLFEQHIEQIFTPKTKNIQVELMKHCSEIVLPNLEKRWKKFFQPIEKVFQCAQFLDIYSPFDQSLSYNIFFGQFGHLVEKVDFEIEFNQYCDYLKRNQYILQSETKRRNLRSNILETPKEKEERRKTEDPIRFFRDNEKRFPILSSIATKVLSIPSSSAEVERSFSKHKLFLTNRRYCFAWARIREIRFLQQNNEINTIPD
eukprot:TRINITY_DN17067_c0_g1_i1.p1 TRINITY_DN17067_c0_g1~~TRINITY_DN17067_c0_g1_i1.p1  ORF type:complete len:232 (+),score=52.28 TRINITY_DN17067_c0_g1_i1:186-881(+)